jgi:thymidylate synthase
MNNIDKQYQLLLKDIIDNGVKKEDRTGTGTISVFGRQIRHKMSEGYPLLTTKKMAFKTMVTELLWFLRGDTNIKYLVDNGCHIWDGDAYKNYLKKVDIDSISKNFGIPAVHHTMEEFIERIKTNDEFAKEWGELGPIYGKQWRSWKGDTWIEGNTDGTEGFYLQTGEVDQIQNLINDIKTNPDSRRLMVNAWNVGEMDEMVLPPCHYGFQVYTRELTEDERLKYWTDSLGKSVHYADDFGHSKLDALKVPRRTISLMWNQRSVDTFLGLPFNIASYALLLQIIAKEVNMVPDELIGNLGDVHLYSNHIQQAKEQINREPMELPKLNINENNKMRVGGGIFTYVNTDFELVNYQSHPSIKAPLSN